MKILNIIYIFSALTLIISCTEPVEEIEWNTGEPIIALNVEGSITTDTIHHSIQLKWSQEYFYNKPLPTVSGAQVSVESAGTTYQFSESDTIPGVYYSIDSFAGKVGNTYTLNIEVEKDGALKTYTASSEIKKNFDIQFARFAEVDYPNYERGDSNLLVFAFVAEDPSPGEDFYFARIYANDTLITDTIGEYILFNDVYDEENDDEGVYYLIAWDDIPVGTELTIELFSVTKKYYQYLEGLFNIMYPMDPFGFSGPHAEVKGNVNNGEAYGYFFCSQVVRYTSILEKGI